MAVEDCGFLTDKELLNEGAIGPDTSELHANASSFLLDSLQSRKSAGRGAPVAAVPSGLEPDMHFQIGMTAKSPLSMEQAVPSDLDWGN